MSSLCLLQVFCITFLVSATRKPNRWPQRLQCCSRMNSRRCAWRPLRRWDTSMATSRGPIYLTTSIFMLTYIHSVLVFPPTPQNQVWSCLRTATGVAFPRFCSVTRYVYRIMLISIFIYIYILHLCKSLYILCVWHIYCLNLILYYE